LHGLKALKASESEIELTFKNVSIGVVGVGEAFNLVPEEKLKEYLILLNQQEQAPEPMQASH